MFFKAGYIESWGRGTNKIIDSCIEAGLPEPLIEEEQGGFSITFLKDIYIEELLKGYGLEDRHIKALLFLKTNARITNKQYQGLFNVSKRTVSYDLQLLLDKNLILKIGSTGKGTYYILQRGNRRNKGAIKRLMGSATFYLHFRSIKFSVAQTIQYIRVERCRHNKVNSLTNMVFYLA